MPIKRWYFTILKLMGTPVVSQKGEIMEIVLSTIVVIAIILGEFFILYLWFTKKYLKNKNMTFGQALRRSKKLYILIYRIKRYYVFPDWNLYCFLMDNKQLYSPIFLNVAVLCAGACLFVFTFLFCTFMMGDVVIQIVICVMLVGGLQHFLVGGEAGATTLDLYIRFLAELEIGFGDEVNSLIKEKIDRKKTEVNRERFMSNDLYIHKKYERYKDYVIKPEDEKWFDKKPFWFLLVVVNAIVLGFYFRHEISLLFSVSAGNDKLLWSWKFSELDKRMGAFFVIQFVIIWGIVNRKNAKRFDFLKVAYNRFLVSVFGPRDIRVKVSRDLWPWDNEIKKMCQKLNIKGIRIEKCHNSQDIATICFDEDGVQVVLLDHYQMEAVKDFFLKQKWNTYHDAVMFIIGHELAHIHFKDTKGRKCASDILLILLGSMAYITVSFCLLEGLNIFYGPFFVLWFISVLLLICIIEPMANDRYWAQVQELRADRVSMGTLGLRTEVFLQFAAYCRENGGMEADKFHPDMELRCRELQQRSTWGISDHIRYSARFTVNRISRRKSIL